MCVYTTPCSLRVGSVWGIAFTWGDIRQPGRCRRKERKTRTSGISDNLSNNIPLVCRFISFFFLNDRDPYPSRRCIEM